MDIGLYVEKVEEKISSQTEDKSIEPKTVGDAFVALATMTKVETERLSSELENIFDDSGIEYVTPNNDGIVNIA